MPFPVDLKPKYSYKLIRLGRNKDGGYLVDKKSIMKSKCLVTIGISTDWSFEESFKKRKSVPIHCYDYSLTTGFFVVYAIKSFLQLFQGKISPFLLAIKTVIKYFFFFQAPVRLYKERIGCANEKVLSINEVISRIPKKYREQVFIKMDIEGSEDRVLDELVDNASIFSGLVIEFHDADLHIDRISNFLNQFSLELIHVHANNNWGLGSDDNAQLLEMTFSRYSTVISAESSLPHALDRTNNIALPEIALEFK